jgi:phospholipase/carboxylesterase
MIAVWRRPTRNAAHAPFVVVLHGRGADEHDLAPVTDRLPARFGSVRLRGLVPVAGGGYTWFENRGPARPIAKSLHASVATLRAWLDEVEPPSPERRCYLLGFSAGMMMAGALLLADPQRFAGAVLLSGAFALEGFAAEPQRLRGVPIFIGRGSRDEMIPAALVTQTIAYLSARSGADLTERVYDHAHAISPREVSDIVAWLDERA